MAEAEIAVLAPAVYLSITIEAGDGDEIHLHAAGQGVWVARMLRQLGHAPIVCAPIGGESGRALMGLTAEWGLQLEAVETRADTPAYVHDRRQGTRVEIARSPQSTLGRHASDALYGRFLEQALRTGRCVVTGPETGAASIQDLYRRLGADLGASGVEVVGDLHGPALEAFLSGGSLRVLKVSAGDLEEDGLLGEGQGSDEDAVRRVSEELRDRGADTVVVSRGAAPVLATTPDGRYRVSGPDLEPVETVGSGDAMTAALASSLARGLDTSTMLAHAWAAGASNITRRGLGSGEAGLVERLTERATVEYQGEL